MLCILNEIYNKGIANQLMIPNAMLKFMSPNVSKFQNHCAVSAASFCNISSSILCFSAAFNLAIVAAKSLFLGVAMLGEKENFGDAEDFSSAFNPLKILGPLMGVAVSRSASFSPASAAD
jgi:hypothetical protein